MIRTNGRLTLWLLAIPVAAWGLHFLGVYVVAAIYCAKSAAFASVSAAPFGIVRWVILGATLAALGIDAAVARRGFRASRGATEPDDQDRFLGTVAMMLCALSAAAIVFVAAVAWFYGDCRR